MVGIPVHLTKHSSRYYLGQLEAVGEITANERKKFQSFFNLVSYIPIKTHNYDPKRPGSISGWFPVSHRRMSTDIRRLYNKYKSNKVTAALRALNALPENQKRMVADLSQLSAL